MALVAGPRDRRERRHGEVEEAVLADPSWIGAPAMTARTWRVPPGESGPEIARGPDEERFLFVVRGSGTAVVGAERLPLSPESVLWLEPGDRYRLEGPAAGSEPLEVLEAWAPGGSG